MTKKLLVSLFALSLTAGAFAADKTDPAVGGAAMYPSKTIVQNASASPDLTTLVAAVKAAGLVDTLSSPGPFTVFAPTNEAFAKLPSGTVDTLVKPENKDTLSKLLTYHVVAGNVSASELVKMIKEGGAQFGTDLKLLAQVVAACRKVTKLPLITKMSPNVVSIAPFARAAEDAGSDALSIMNSYPAMAIDIETRQPKLANVTGGLTGPCIKPIAVKLVWEAAQGGENSHHRHGRHPERGGRD